MISVENLTKSYLLAESRHYVFKNVSFEFPERTNIGILGPNGAGKSTLLRILGKIDFPDSGTVKSSVSVSWPLGLKGGFIASMSGYENCKMIFNLYGIDSSQSRTQLDRINEIAGLGKYFFEPVAYYSSGMGARLGFALSMVFEFECYLIDELTAVGDGEFKRIAKQLFEEKSKKSNLIMVSHSMGDIRRFCDVGVLVKNGKVTIYDDIEDCIREYLPKTQAKIEEKKVVDVSKVVGSIDKQEEQSKKENSLGILKQKLNEISRDLNIAREEKNPIVIARNYARLAHAHMVLGQWHMAIEAVNTAIEMNPDARGLYLRKAAIAERLEDLGALKEALETGLKLDPMQKGLNTKAAFYYFRVGEYDSALKCCENAISLERDSEELHALRVRTLGALQRWSDAVEAAAVLIDGWPKNRDYKLWLVHFLSNTESDEKSLDYLFSLLNDKEAISMAERALADIEVIEARI
ncbi:MAG: ATP-binding cassette domain-containing protein [Opitutales bacterium]